MQLFQARRTDIRYYLAATLLVILLLPDKSETPKKPESGNDMNFISKLRRNENKAINNISAKRASQTVPAFLPEKDTKDTNAQSEKKIKNLYP